MVVYQDKKVLRPEKGIELEVKSYYTDKAHKRVIFAPGLGWGARSNPLTEEFARNFHFVTFSPRNSGESNGNFGARNYVHDLGVLAEDVAQDSGQMPCGIGHSFGGYCIGKLAENKEVFEKAILLAPLINLYEQNPKIVDGLFKLCSKNDVIARLIGGGLDLAGGLKGVRIDEQRFNYPHLKEFLGELYSSPKVGDLKIPTQVYLAGRTNCRLRIKNLQELARQWNEKGAEVRTYPELNHWFSGYGYSGPEGAFSLCKENGISDAIGKFLTNSAS